MIWLFKEEPRNYSYDALERDGGTRWTGVRNPLAQKHLRSIRKGDRILYYHSGKDKAVVGVARAVSNAYDDPDDSSGRLATVDIAPVMRLRRPVGLHEIRKHGGFATSPLLRIPRLSVMPVNSAEMRAIESLARAAPPGPGRRSPGIVRG
ncbi:MAG TPA: EVE domain-containing protein [Candidatus Polarisedimenticolia bacterium]|nr:EVE domain-containing protein [Candidatus Polarisedimenticolia bacterium]